MGKQFGFLMDKKDEKNFLDYVLEIGKIYSKEQKFKAGQIYEVSDEFIEYNWFKVYFSTKDEVNISYIELPNDRNYIDGITQPIVEYCRTGINEPDKSVIRGRLWVEMKYYDDEDKLRSKSNELDKLYRDLCKWIRRNLKKLQLKRMALLGESMSANRWKD